MNKQYCYFCFIDEIGLCDLCISELNVCVNCIVYGNGDICNGCLSKDEAIILDHDLFKVLEWIRRNDFYFLAKTQNQYRIQLNNN